MRRILPVLVLSLGLVLPALAHAETTPFATTGRLGLGFGGGSMASGLSGKFYLSQALAVQASLGLWAGYGWSVGADAILEMPQIWKNEAVSINWNVGAGAGVGFHSAYYSAYYSANGTEISVGGVAGLGIQFSQFPVELTAELRPTLFLGNTGFDFGSGGAIRYFF